MRVAVIGSGFSGISVTYWLIKNGIYPTVFDIQTPKKASDVPLGLLNSVTGRRALPVWRGEEGLDLSFSFLEELQEFSAETLFLKNSVIRTAMNEEMATYYKAAIPSYPEKTLEWLDSAALRSLNPLCHAELGGLLIKNAGTVNGASVCNAWNLYSANHHQIKSIQCSHISFEHAKDCVSIEYDHSKQTFDTVIFCTGSTLPYIDDLDLKRLIVPVKGQLLKGKLIKNLPFCHSFIGHGYFSAIKDLAVFGSTYEHEFESLDATEEGRNQLIGQLDETFPKWNEYFSIENQWTGVRASTPDRMPLVGNFNFFKRMYFYLGNGSKGMIWSFLLGKYLVDNLVNGNPIPKEINIKRFEKRVL